MPESALFLQLVQLIYGIPTPIPGEIRLLAWTWIMTAFLWGNTGNVDGPGRWRDELMMVMAC